ncbi:hypothetical protein HIO71_13955 [Chryseobacterium aquaticum]|jgi:hypothetical protein|uniref:DUF6876 domain-containing protein n=3 Tax=Chryseobacterium TaxID=59732 RepID=A0A848N2G3_9FLAO|nr:MULTISPECIES: DUF6876 family protein [Chryseobacterium]MDV3993883.1 hypothetical protein [Elizabethkingia anophelis]AZA79673.1 hypothetical protein EG347_20380 [Chryseobacterium sp. G0186]AZB35719.1 hypothetical protein EG351_20435 [Chryseobacterium bernardetii]EFK35929.1 hypothetical protein HMPREF0204_14998 [Chryseobacterium gleum ATCC 35910]NMR35287.1 hypothetical protein [Chryseobacterium aquaticum]
MKNPNISANDFYDSFMGTESYYSYIGKLLLTDGVITIAREESCFWFLDCIASYQYSEKFQKEEFQVWKIERIEANRFNLSATDGNDNVLATQDIEFSDFFFNEFTIWKEDNVLLLPVNINQKEPHDVQAIVFF